MLAFVPRVLVIADVEPGPAVESARLHAAYVIRYQIFAELVPLVRAHPKLVRSRTNLNPDRVPNSPRKNILLRAVRIELENARPIRFGRVIGSIRERADRDVHLFAIWRKRETARPVTASAEQPTAGKLGAQFFYRASRLGVAVAIRKSNDAIRVGHVKKLRIGAGRIKRDPKRLAHSAVRERLGQVWFPVAIVIAQNFNAAFIALRHEDVAVRSCEQITRIRKAARVLLDLKTWRDPRLRARRPTNFSR